MLGKKVFRTIYFVRHGKASMGDLGVSDRERKLVTKGIEESKRMAEILLKEGIKVDRVVCSDAHRAYQTAIVMAEVFGYPIAEIRQESSLYLADEDRLLSEVMILPNEVKTVVVVAHNPGLTDLVNIYLDQPMYAMPPSSLVGLRFKVNQWDEIAHHRGQVIKTLLPHSSY